MPVATLAVPDMTCGNCVRHIREALAGVAGIGSCAIDADARRVRIEAADQRALDAARDRLAEEGYPTTVVG